MMWHSPPDGWDTFGTNLSWPGELEFSNDLDAEGFPLWERKKASK